MLELKLILNNWGSFLNMTKKLSIIIPCYFEEESIPLFYEAVEEINKTVEIHADTAANSNPIETAEGIEDIYDEESTEELSEIIPSEAFTPDFEALAANEGLIKTEEICLSMKKFLNKSFQLFSTVCEI